MKSNILLLIFFIFPALVMAQITSSPYTIYGFGKMENKGISVNQALGGTGIALQSKNSLNNLNPASYSGIDSLSFLFEFGVFGQRTYYSNFEKTQKKFDAGFNYLAIGFRFNKWWAASLGVTPYSSIGYTINSTSQVVGEQSDYLKVYKGSGGLNQFYFGNAFRLTKNISVGVNASYFFGVIQQGEISYITQSQNTITYDIEKTKNIHHFYFDYGLQYAIQPGNLRYVLGLTYGNKMEWNSSYNENLYYKGDTVNITNKTEPFLLPEKYGVGLAVEKANKLRIGLDYSLNKWSELNLAIPSVKSEDSRRLSIGGEYTPGTGRGNDAFLKRLYYRIGASYEKSYLVIDNEPMNSATFDIGVGIPLRGSLSMMNISVEYGDFGTSNHGLIKENYWLININASLHDLWFMKRKFN